MMFLQLTTVRKMMICGGGRKNLFSLTYLIGRYVLFYKLQILY